MRKPTLTWSLFIRVAPTILVTVLAIGWLAFRSATQEIHYVYDARMIDDANTLWNLLQKPLLKYDFVPPRRFRDLDLTMGNQLSLNDYADDYADAEMFRVWKNGAVAIYSSTAFNLQQPLSRPGFSTLTYDGERWRVYTLHISGQPIVIEVGEKIALRETLVSTILLNLVLPLLILIPLIGVLMWFGIRRGLRTIYGLVDQIRSRSPDDLSFIPADELPRDLAPLAASVNQLLGKLERSLTAERRFADHAAHQLRTPYAGLKLLLQMLQQTDDEAERKEIVADLVRSNDRALRLIEQLLRSGRVSHQEIQSKRLNLYDMAASVLAELGLRVREKRLDVTLEGTEKAFVKTDGPLLRLLIENLVENAIKYTPGGGKIRVSVRESGETDWQLTVCDTGPGIPAGQREAVFQRFYRASGSPQTEGAGLGLAIVADIAQRLSAEVSLGVPDWGRGLRVDVVLARARRNGERLQSRRADKLM
ncbi:MAG: two-component sensor histidine kinase [Rhizobiales bacterium 63-22]|nr:MAG: two-component sensor histidine kinase [Rhizobiales bacterium 63-22]